MTISTELQPEFGYPKPRNIRLYLRMNGWQERMTGSRREYLALADASRHI